MRMEIREHIAKEIDKRIREFEVSIKPTGPNLDALDRNVKWWHDRRQKNAENNARIYGIDLVDAGPRMTRERMMSETLSMKGITRAHMGIPEDVELLDIRDVSRRLLVSPFTVLRWIRQGMPCVNYYPWRRFDLRLIKKWLADNEIEVSREVTTEELNNMTRYVLAEVQAGRASIDDALEVLEGQ